MTFDLMSCLIDKIANLRQCFQKSVRLSFFLATDATTGGTDDYAKGAAGVKYAFCPELRGNSFVIAASNIPLSFNEVWNGIVAMASAINA
jgi:hypothetical protein